MKEINLLPPFPPKRLLSINRWVRVSGILLSTLLLLLTMIHISQTKKIRAKKQQLQELITLQNQSKSTTSDPTINTQKHERLTERLAKMDHIEKGNDYPSIYLPAIADALPDDVRLQSITQQKNGELTINALAQTVSDAIQFLHNLDKSVHFNTSHIQQMKTQSDNQILLTITTAIHI